MCVRDTLQSRETLASGEVTGVAASDPLLRDTAREALLENARVRVRDNADGGVRTAAVVVGLRSRVPRERTIVVD